MTTPAPSSRATVLWPGIALCAAVAGIAWLVQRAEVRLIGHAVVDALVIAILFGVLLRTAWPPTPRFQGGIAYAGAQLLELGVMLLGISVDASELFRAGPAMLAGIVLVVVIGLAGGIAIGRALGLAPKLGILIACGNAICGNSAIAAVAPVIGADAKDVASAIAFTAVLGVLMVLGLPMLIGVLGLSDREYGALAGMTVYAVPQVLAATFPVSPLAGQVGTLVKLVRVVMLGPVVLYFTLRARQTERSARIAATRLVPWFIIGFVALALLRSLGVVPDAIGEPVRELSRWLTTLAMAALGLGVDVRAVGRAGARVTLTVTLSLVVLLAASMALILMLRTG